MPLRWLISKYKGIYPTLPQGFRGFFVEHFEDRNNFRMRSYHRLDVGVNFKKKREKWSRTISIGAYNTYNRKNPFFIFTDEVYEKWFQSECIEAGLIISSDPLHYLFL